MTVEIIHFEGRWYINCWELLANGSQFLRGQWVADTQHDAQRCAESVRAIYEL